MAKSYCEAHRLPCLHEPQCISDCYLDAAPDSWHTVGALMFGAILAVLVVFFTLIFFTIMYLWSLLI